jgi:nitrate reductase gamma subunit
MTWAIYATTYACLAVFFSAVAFRLFRLAGAPVHLRWELYPLPGERPHTQRLGPGTEKAPGRAVTRAASLARLLARMFPEMLFLRTLWLHNRPLWVRSFLFHFGLYLSAATIALLVLGALIETTGTPVAARSESAIGTLVYLLTLLAGPAGFVLALLGTLGLIHRRLTDEDLRGFTSPAHLFNLAFFLVTLSVALAAFAFVDPTFAVARRYVRGLITFSPTPLDSRLAALEVTLASLLVAYIPLTHMSHFFSKWFIYHGVLWDDEPNQTGSRLERRLLEALAYPVSWSAPHIGGDGRKTWAEVAREEVKK